jgi:hypothetical protein
MATSKISGSSIIAISQDAVESLAFELRDGVGSGTHVDGPDDDVGSTLARCHT